MSGAFKSIGKAFKKVAMAPIKLAKKVDKAVKKVVKKVWQNKIMRMIIIAVAAYFTAGAALAYFGAAGAAGGAAAAGAAATTGATAATTAMASGAAVGAATASAGVAATTLSAVTVTATVGATGAASVAGAIAAASVGAAAGVAVANAASDAASGAMSQGNGTVTGAPGGMGTAANAGGTGQGMFGPVGSVTNGATNLEGMTVTANAAGDVTGAAGGLTSGLAAGAADALAGAAAGGAQAQTGNDLIQDKSTDAPEEKQDSWLGKQYDKARDGFKNLFGKTDGAEAGAGSEGSTGSMMGSFGKTMLLKTAVDFAASYLQKPAEPLQYSGVNKQGQGFGLGLHTINGGFGLAAGGPGQAPSTGVPDALKPPVGAGTAGSYAMSLSNAALAGKSGQQDGGAGNIGQTVANSAGVGGLVPQGAVNFMGS